VIAASQYDECPFCHCAVVAWYMTAHQTSCRQARVERLPVTVEGKDRVVTTPQWGITGDGIDPDTMYFGNEVSAETNLRSLHAEGLAHVRMVRRTITSVVRAWQDMDEEQGG
jgi:hypothetical protein